MKLQFEKLDSIKLVAMLLAVLTFVVAAVCMPLNVYAADTYNCSYVQLFNKLHNEEVTYLSLYTSIETEMFYYAQKKVESQRNVLVAYSTKFFYYHSGTIVSDSEAEKIVIEGVTYYYCFLMSVFRYDDYKFLGVHNVEAAYETDNDDLLPSQFLKYYITGQFPDDVDRTDTPEKIDSELVIYNLESYENRDSVVTGLTTYVTWDALGGNDYDPSKLYLEAKVNFSTQNKRTGDKKSYTDVPLKSMEDGVKDTAGKFSFVNYNFLADYCDANGIDDTNLLYITDNIYCRYAYDGQDGVVYGEWQRVGDVVPTIDDADYSHDIELENLKYKELQPATGKRQHYVSFDIKDGYDANTYLLVSADIKWKPALNKTNVATYVPIVDKGDKYLASSGEWSMDVDTLWKNYFDAEGINYSAFTSQWADKLYFQVVKWSEIDNKWYSSNLYAVDLTQQTTGVVGSLQDVGPGRIDSETGTFINGKYDETGKFVEGNDGHYYVDKNTGEIVENAYGGIFDGMDLPEGSTILDYITALGTALISGISSLLSAVGQVPKMIGAVISFLPSTLITLIGIGLVIAIVLRILGR